MALPSSGPLSIGDIAGEFGGTAPHSMSEYYGAAAGVPASGTISIGDFRGTSSAIYTQVTGTAGWTIPNVGAHYSAYSVTSGIKSQVSVTFGKLALGSYIYIYRTFTVTAGVQLRLVCDTVVSGTGSGGGGEVGVTETAITSPNAIISLSPTAISGSFINTGGSHNVVFTPVGTTIYLFQSAYAVGSTVQNATGFSELTSAVLTVA